MIESDPVYGYYYATCDDCFVSSASQSTSEDAAEQVALDAGWCLTVDGDLLCPGCVRAVPPRENVFLPPSPEKS